MRTHFQVPKDTQNRKNQKFFKNDIDELVVKNYPKKNQPIQQQRKLKPTNCPRCQRNKWLEFDKGYYCQFCEYIIDKPKHQIDKKDRRQDQKFSTRLPYANKKIRKIYIHRANANTTEDMIANLQSLKGKTKLNFYENSSNYYDEIKHKNFRFEEDPFAKNAQGISEIYHEVILLMKFLQTKPQVRNMNFKYFDLYYSLIKKGMRKKL